MNKKRVFLTVLLTVALSGSFKAFGMQKLESDRQDLLKTSKLVWLSQEDRQNLDDRLLDVTRKISELSLKLEQEKEMFQDLEKKFNQSKNILRNNDLKLMKRDLYDLKNLKEEGDYKYEVGRLVSQISAELERRERALRQVQQRKEQIKRDVFYYIYIYIE
ncbi:hypothetical protein ACFLYA_01485 [Candidatus Dependentiae bacterium]